MHSWFGPGGYSIADIALYAYTHIADEGGFDLAGFAHLNRWPAEVRAQPGHITLLQETSAAPVVTLDGVKVVPQLPDDPARPRNTLAMHPE